MKFKVDGEMVKKVAKIVTIAVPGVVAVIGAIADQKKAAELEEMKNAITELQKK